MRKLLKTTIFLTTLIICLSFCGCNSDNNNSKEEVITEAATEPPTNATIEPTTEEYLLDSEFVVGDITFKVSSNWGFTEDKESNSYYWYTTGGNFIMVNFDANNEFYKFDTNDQKSYLDGMKSVGYEVIESENITLFGNNNVLKSRQKMNGVISSFYTFLLNNRLYLVSGTEDVDGLEGNLECLEKFIDSIEINEPSTEKPIELATEPATEKSIPKEYTNALTKAKIYSDTMHMSKAAIHDQLTSEYGEGFSEEAANYAMENLVADYKANALHKAHTYQDTMAMSTSAIYDQLISEYGEQFTEEEAQYAIDNLE